MPLAQQDRPPAVAPPSHIHRPARTGAADDTLTFAELARLRAAALRARREFPGPIGQVLSRELTAFADFGHRFGGSGLIVRLADDILAGAGRAAPPSAGPRREPG